jgi:hypothetical protein
VRALVVLLMRGRSHAVTASAVSAALSLLFPPLSYFSGAVIGLATLKQGPREGLLVIAGSVLLAGVFALLIARTPVPALAFLGMTWLPAWLMAMVLRYTHSQGATVVLAAGLGVIVVLATHVVVDDPVVWWRGLLSDVFASSMHNADANVIAQLELMLDAWAPRMTRIFGVVTTVGLVGTLLISRSWHAMLDNPGGFGREFRQLHVGKVAIYVSLGVGLADWGLNGGVGQLASELMGPLSAMLVFQGLAVVHTLARVRKVSGGWLVAMYLLLLIPPHLAMSALAVTGLVDGLIDLRARLVGKES